MILDTPTTVEYQIPVAIQVGEYHALCQVSLGMEGSDPSREAFSQFWQVKRALELAQVEKAYLPPRNMTVYVLVIIWF
jgi:hypothetical protein